MIANPNFFRRPRYGADAATLNMGGGQGGGPLKQAGSWGGIKSWNAPLAAVAPTASPAKTYDAQPYAAPAAGFGNLNEATRQVGTTAMPPNSGFVSAPPPAPVPVYASQAQGAPPPAWAGEATRDVGVTAMPANSGFVGSPTAQPVGVYAASAQPAPAPAWAEAATRDVGVSTMPPNSGTVSDQYTAPINAQPSLQNDPFALRRYWQQQANLRSGRVY